jgi:quinol monooxygenase YgiN
MAKVASLLTVKAQPGRRDDVRRLWDKHVRPRAEADDAQELYVICEDTQDADTLHLFAIYANPEAMAENARSAWFTEYLNAVTPLLAGPGVRSTATPIWAKGAAL